MTANAMGIIFSNMHDEKLPELTANRTMASVPFGGRYRLIDFVLSNMYNSGVTKVGVITKTNYQSLIDHLGTGKEWDLSHKREGLYILPPFSGSSGVYKSRIEALAGISAFIRKSNYENIILADCDTICNMDLDEPVRFHAESRADITAVCLPVKKDSHVGSETVFYELGKGGRVKEITIGDEAPVGAFAGLNLWVVRKELLERVVAQAVSRGESSWTRDVLQKKHDQLRVFGWEFDGYAGQIASMDDYFRVNKDLLSADIRNELFYKNGHIYTKVRDEVPAKYGENANVKNSLVADGCVIEGTVSDSILFRGVHIGRGTIIRHSLVMQGSTVENNVSLSYAIVDKDATVRESRTLMGYDTYPLYISKGSII